MSDYSNLLVTPLTGSHDRQGFCCGVDSLDDYIRKQANQDVKRRVSRVFVAATAAHPDTIVGYYTLSSLFLDLGQLPERLARKLPRHPIPAALLGRLAVSQVARSHGVGRMLLVDAIKRTLAVSGEIAIYALVVDAIDERAQGFYEQFGFSPLSSESRRLFLPLKSVRAH
ncbi:MAG: GNAT family N-acetyltransferase [Porticoccaceae bacterium]